VTISGAILLIPSDQESVFDPCLTIACPQTVQLVLFSSQNISEAGIRILSMDMKINISSSPSRSLSTTAFAGTACTCTEEVDPVPGVVYICIDICIDIWMCCVVGTG